MRSLLVLTCVLFAGYSHAVPTTSNVDEGNSLITAVITNLEQIEKCYLQNPNNDTINFKPVDESGEKYELLDDIALVSLCRVTIHDLTPNDDGLWTLYAVTSQGEVLHQHYDVTVNPKSVQEPEEVVPEYLTEQVVQTTLGSTHTFFIPDFTFVTGEECQIINQNGEKFDLNQQTLDGMELFTAQSFCGVTITVTTDDQVGNWTLIETGKRYGVDIERRLPIIVSVEVIVHASPSNITVGEHNNLHVGLQVPIANPETCKLFAPDGSQYSVDAQSLSNTCQYSVPNVQKEANGTWAIVYGKRIVYRAPFDVHVIGRADNANDLTLVWTLASSVHQTIGPEDAIYCKISSPNGEVFEGYGKCNITIERVSLFHSGSWRMAVGLAGHVIADETVFNVQVREAEPKATVTTNVEAVEPTITISCSVQSPAPVHNCKFRDPRGNILLAHEGVSQGRYTYYRSMVGNDEQRHTHTCGLKISYPTLSELGFWRCEMQTDDDIFYGHLSVRSPWLLIDPEDAAAIPTEPALTARPDAVSAAAGDAVTFACRAPAALRYCYFRASNGTVFYVGPGTTSSMQYAGAGLAAGECGARVSLAARDSGAWSCHAGVDGAELRANFSVHVTQALSVVQYNDFDSTTVKAQMHTFTGIDYCVFVRSDGLGITRANALERYTVTEFPTDGYCDLTASRPSDLDRRPWTVIARLRGQDGAMVQVTDLARTIPPVYSFRFPTIWLAVMLVGLCMALLAAILTPNKNRRWVAARASSVSHSIRNSFRKPQINNTPVAA